MQECKDEDAVIGLVDLVVNLVALCHAVTDSRGNRLAHVEVDAEQAGLSARRTSNRSNSSSSEAAALGATSTLAMWLSAWSRSRSAGPAMTTL